MKETGKQIEYDLTPGHLLRVTHASGRRIECVSGRALISVAGEAADIELGAGQVFVIPNGGLTLIEAPRRGRIRLAAPAPRRAAGWRGLADYVLRALRSSSRNQASLSAILPSSPRGTG